MQLVIHQGDFTTIKKIPTEVNRLIASNANNFLRQPVGISEKLTATIDFTLTNLRVIMEAGNEVKNVFCERILTFLLQTATVDMVILPFKDISHSTITVMVLTCALAVSWTVTVAYLIVVTIKRRKQKYVIILNV